jgi:hypothetical protein
LLALIELRLAAASATILSPLGILSQTDFFLYGVVRWLGASLVRIFALGILVAAAILISRQIPLMGTETITLDSSWTLVGLSFVLAVMSWILPSIAAGMVAGGSNAMGAWHLMGAGLVVFGMATRTSNAIRSAASMARMGR